MLSFQKEKPFVASWPCDGGQKLDILRRLRTSSARSANLRSTWLARMAAFLRWRRALRATKKRELSTKPRYVNLRRTFKSPKARLRKFGNTSCRRISYSTPKPLAWQRAKRGETICKAACASSCRLRGSFRDFWSRLTTRQPGFALRGSGKLQIRLLP